MMTFLSLTILITIAMRLAAHPQLRGISSISVVIC
jgi:hypothetical protein